MMARSDRILRSHDRRPPMTTTPILLVCDHRGEGLREALLPLASVGFRLETCGTLGETRAALERMTPDLVVIDPLARGGALELEQLREAREGSGIPILLIAAPLDPLPTLAATRDVTDTPCDVVRRDAPFEEFLLRIDRLRSEARRLEELEHMRFRAVHDDRTQLLRPTPFEDRLREHFSAAQRHRLELALVLIDLDRFGMVNKDHDHTVGDAVIGEVGRVVRDFLRAEDVGGRLGGDEFGLILPYTQRIDAARVVGRIRDQIAALSGPRGTGEVRVTASIGFETYDGTDMDSVEVLRRRAELALRRAKERGGDQGLYYRSLAEASGAEETGT